MTSILITNMETSLGISSHVYSIRESQSNYMCWVSTYIILYTVEMDPCPAIRDRPESVLRLAWLRSFTSVYHMVKHKIMTSISCFDSIFMSTLIILHWVLTTTPC